MRNPVQDRSIEYNDNRISEYTAQLGKCAVTGKILSCGEIHCHHIKPSADGGTDKFQNLIIVHKDIHRLIHETSHEVINRVIKQFQPTQKQFEKTNELRIKVKNGVIAV
ncbi:HNH endonuclease signature motif containing protein [Oceanobacillus sp. AG]|uniref:HNH endonuclease signature motif containing protein n=1 Tax=Oceanobacillus sp. AG TaxID=2681969 RepID=UPI0018DE1E6D|nr:HNH endonuclease signature motif containing protein [Oceanobacillus sp. AG]